jgi:hypothetical protein
MAASGPEKYILGVCHWGIVVIRAEVAIFQFVNIAIPVVAQTATDALLVASIWTAMKTANVRDTRLLLSPHLGNNFE